MLKDWIAALNATDVPPDAMLTTQRLLDQQTRLAQRSEAESASVYPIPTDAQVAASQVRYVPPATTQARWSANTLPESLVPVADSRIDTHQWEKAAAEVERHVAHDPTHMGQSAATHFRKRRLPRSLRKRFGWLLGFCITIAVASAVILGYSFVNSWVDSQQRAVNEQKRVAEEALAAAELARSEALDLVATQRQSVAAQAKREAERTAAEAAAEAARVEAAKLEAERQAVAASQRAGRVARRQAAQQAQRREQRDALLDNALQSLLVNDLTAARASMAEARAYSIPIARLREMDEAFAAAEANARQPIEDAEFERVVERFHLLKQAIESGDMQAVELFTEGARELALFERLVDSFSRIEVSISDIWVRNVDKSIVGTLRIERMIRDNGNRTTPSTRYQDRKILSRRVNGVWSDIIW